MLNERERLEADCLAVIRDADQPVGCGTLSSVLRQLGHVVSEATVGRLLRDFDQTGYTQKAGFQGRVLSAAGRERLAALADKERSLQWGAEFSEAIKGHDKEKLLEVLIARRAIESELAALAAVNATAEELRLLNAIVDEQRRTLAAGEMTARQDVDFHAMIARMARNQILASAIGLIRQDTQLSPVLEYIRKHVHSKLYIDHDNIRKAILARRSDQARQAMTAHLDSLMADVERFWETTLTSEADAE
ncbi:MAG: FCD domain-containing protein [Sporomusaceae bacterium]|nr:FCD domain-containing protein [Sporomusaceae bacterium]